MFFTYFIILFCTQLEILMIFFNFRSAYLTNKQLAETGSRLERGESVQPMRTMEVNHACWLITFGGGFGKSQWRSIFIFVGPL